MWSGWVQYNYSGTMYGVRADILNYSPWVYDPGEWSVSTSWVMLSTQAGGRWAQVGWLEKPYDARRTFVQFSVPNAPYFHHFEWQPEPVGQLTQYRVLYGYPNSDSFSFYVNGNGVLSTNWPQYTPDKAEVSGEVTSYANQMPGGYLAPELLFNSYYQITNGGTYYSFDGDEVNTLWLFGWEQRSQMI